MKYEPRKPARLGAERRETERAVIAEMKTEKETCPECGSADYHMVEGCHLCRSCGYTPCGVH